MFFGHKKLYYTLHLQDAEWVITAARVFREEKMITFLDYPDGIAAYSRLMGIEMGLGLYRSCQLKRFKAAS